MSPKVKYIVWVDGDGNRYTAVKCETKEQAVRVRDALRHTNLLANVIVTKLVKL